MWLRARRARRDRPLRRGVLRLPRGGRLVRARAARRLARRLLPARVVTHTGRGSDGDRASIRIRKYFAARNTILFARKHASRLERAKLACFLAASLPLELLRHLADGPCRRGAAQDARHARRARRPPPALRGARPAMSGRRWLAPVVAGLAGGGLRGGVPPLRPLRPRGRGAAPRAGGARGGRRAAVPRLPHRLRAALLRAPGGARARRRPRRDPRRARDRARRHGGARVRGRAHARRDGARGRRRRAARRLLPARGPGERGAVQRAVSRLVRRPRGRRPWRCFSRAGRRGAIASRSRVRSRAPCSR